MLQQGCEEQLRKSFLADDRDFDGCDGDVEEVMTIRPGDLCCVFVVVFAKEELEDGLDES